MARFTCLIALLCGACSAPLSRPASAPPGALTPNGYSCPDLDAQHRAWGGVAKFSGVLAGAGGIATLPISDDAKTARVTVAISALVLGGLAAASVFIEEDAASTWAKECGK